MQVPAAPRSSRPFRAPFAISLLHDALSDRSRQVEGDVERKRQVEQESNQDAARDTCAETLAKI